VVLRAAVFKRSRGELLFMAPSLTGAKVVFFCECVPNLRKSIPAGAHESCKIIIKSMPLPTCTHANRSVTHIQVFSYVW
jgi:hypothetical protein